MHGPCAECNRKKTHDSELCHNVVARAPHANLSPKKKIPHHRTSKPAGRASSERFKPFHSTIRCISGILCSAHAKAMPHPENHSLIEDHLFLVEVIAFDYANIPGCQLGEALSDGNLALVRAAQAYDPSRGEFIPFASRVIRNALNSLYAKQLRIIRMFPKSIDDPIQWPQASATGSIESQSDHSGHADSGPDTLKGIRIRETSSAIESAMNLLTPRERLVINAFRVGASFPEIGARLGISKQAAHKSVKSGLMKLRDGLARMGYRGLATDGQLGSLKSEKLPPRG